LFLDSDRLAEHSPAEVLQAAARAHIGLDQRFLHALLDRRGEALPAALAFAKRDLSRERVDLAQELIEIFRYWKAPEALPFLLSFFRHDPNQHREEAMEAIADIGGPALEPLLELYQEIGDEQARSDIGLTLASLGMRDNRILDIFKQRFESDPFDALFLFGVYGDRAVRPWIEAQMPSWSEENRKYAAEILDLLNSGKSLPLREAQEPFDIWSHFPEEEDPWIDLLDEDERLAIIDHPKPAIREAIASSFFNCQLEANERKRLLQLARSDPSPSVRARAWESLMLHTDDMEIVEAMLAALRRPETPWEERAGLLVALSPECGRNEVRKAIEDGYRIPEIRAKALEAMWRSVHPSFRDYFARHIEDPDLELRRGAVWGIGYFGIVSELDRLRRLFDDEHLRADALFAYALAIPAELSRGRLKGLLKRIERDACGLSEMEEELVRTALDERLIMSGKEPFFAPEED
jgi:HEAT repeat protein